MSYGGGIFFRKLDNKDAIKNHPEMLQEALDLGKKAVAEYKEKAQGSVLKAQG